MEEAKVKGIVLKNYDYKEKDKQAVIFTLENGLMTAKFKGVKNLKSKLKSAKEIFCFADFVISSNQNIVTSAEIIDSFYNLTTNVKKFYCATTMLEILISILKENQPNQLLFLNIIKALKTLAYEDVNLYYVLDKFILSVLDTNGFKFNYHNCNNCGVSLNTKIYYNVDFGEIVCSGCRAGRVIEISMPTFKALKLLSELDYEKLNSLKLAENSEIEVYKLLAIAYEAHFGKKIKPSV